MYVWRTKIQSVGENKFVNLAFVLKINGSMDHEKIQLL